MMSMLGGGAGGAGALGGGAAPAAADTRPAEERFAVQLTQLENMGFSDKPSNIQALTQSGGDVNGAISALLGGS